VRLSVCLSVTQVFMFHVIRFFLIFYIKLAYNKPLEMQYTDFLEKYMEALVWAKWDQNGPNLRVFNHLSEMFH
jgi:hypothetical protein